VGREQGACAWPVPSTGQPDGPPRQAASSDPAPRKILTGLATALGIDPKNIGGQVEDLTEGYAEVAPYFQRWSPEWWDTLHGSSGSTASLASAIADAHRYQDMDAPTAVGMAETIFDEFYSDPMKHRGFSARDLGKIYREGAKRGYFHVGMDPDQMVEEMTPVVGVASAVRDSMPSDYDRSDIAGIFEGIDKTLPAYGNQGWGEMEKHIRTTKHLSPERGGLMAAALRDTPLTGSRTTLPELEAQHARLTQQAAGSPVAAQLAATSRMVQDGLISENSEAARMLEEDPGALAAMNPQEWVAEVGRAGVDQQVAMTMMNQPNEQLITPSLAHRSTRCTGRSRRRERPGIRSAAVSKLASQKGWATTTGPISSSFTENRSRTYKTYETAPSVWVNRSK